MKPVVFRVKGWAEYFESAKSRTYKHRSQCYMPNKHGLGYRIIMEHPEGPAIFGAWCALIQILSRQYPRHGYLTDTGLSSGYPYGIREIALLIGMKEPICELMLKTCSSKDVQWLEVTTPTDTTGIPQGYHEDTTGIPQGYHGDTVRILQSPYPSPLPSPSPLPTPSPSPEGVCSPVTSHQSPDKEPYSPDKEPRFPDKKPKSSDTKPNQPTDAQVAAKLSADCCRVLEIWKTKTGRPVVEDLALARAIRDLVRHVGFPRVEKAIDRAVAGKQFPNAGWCTLHWFANNVNFEKIESGLLDKVWSTPTIGDPLGDKHRASQQHVSDEEWYPPGLMPQHLVNKNRSLPSKTDLDAKVGIQTAPQANKSILSEANRRLGDSETLTTRKIGG